MSRTPRSGEDLLGRLVEANVLVPDTADEDEFRLSEDFESTRADQRRAFESEDRFAEAAIRYTDGTPVAPEDVSDALLSTVVALDDALGSDVGGVELLRVALTLRTVDADHPTGGVPPGFVSIRGEDIPTFVALNPAAVVYCWRTACPPCETVAGDFEVLLEENAIPSEVALAAVYGPECPEILAEEYSVSVAPTTLFCVDGRVDSRIIGAKTPETFQSEIQTVLDRSALRP